MEFGCAVSGWGVYGVGAEFGCAVSGWGVYGVGAEFGCAVSGWGVYGVGAEFGCGLGCGVYGIGVEFGVGCDERRRVRGAGSVCGVSGARYSVCPVARCVWYAGRVGYNTGMYTGLNDEQKHAVTVSDSSLLIVAGAGTGKTRVLVEKIMYLLKIGVPGNAVLALTFTNKAADEMRNRLHAYSGRGMPFVGTFHSFCVSLLREYHTQAGVPERFVIFDRDACRRVLKRCMKQEAVTDFTPRVIQHAVSRLKTGLAADDDSEEVRAAATVLPAYSSVMRGESALDFDDLLITAMNMLNGRKDVLAEVRSAYSYILVDEFQDTDAIQNHLISLLKGSVPALSPSVTPIRPSTHGAAPMCRICCGSPRPTRRRGRFF